MMNRSAHPRHCATLSSRAGRRIVGSPAVDRRMVGGVALRLAVLRCVVFGGLAIGLAIGLAGSVLSAEGPPAEALEAIPAVESLPESQSPVPGGVPVVDDEVFTALRIEPSSLRLVAGERAAFLVSALRADGTEVDVTERVSAALGGSKVAVLEAAGWLRGVAGGADVVTADLDGFRVEVAVTVVERSGKPPTFERDVLPVLSRAGCAAGACHAKADGQRGFRLSVFSYDPQSDFRQIVAAARGRRVFPASPEESLLLLKATQEIPHEGGERLVRSSDGYRTLIEWIGGGMPYRDEASPAVTRIEVFPKERRYRKGARQRLVVQAHHSDGSVRDVTALAGFSVNDKSIANVGEDGVVGIEDLSGQAVIVARFMGLVGDSKVLVPADRLQPESAYAGLPVRNFIDDLAYAQFRRLGVVPSAACSDGEFLRRATLDTIGLLPSADEARAFLDDPDPEKRTKLVDRLLAHPAYADHWATQWADLLRPNPDRVGVKSVYLLDQWLRQVFRENRPVDEWVRQILLSQGNTHRDGPAVIYRDRREPAELTTMFSQLFLGVRLDCAKCHHHPNEKWSQDDFHQFAAFFAPLRQKGGGISAPISGGNETFFVVAGGAHTHPVTGAVMKPKPPDGPLAEVSPNGDPRDALAGWLLAPENPFFARAMANRIWSRFFGKGIVDPVDDFRLSNPASNPALLDALAADLVRAKYDMKSLMRSILTSHVYQLRTEPNETNAGDTRNFSRAYRRRLGAEAMADAIVEVTGVPTHYPGLPPGSRAAQAWTYKIDSRTMDAFGRPNSSSDCPCERNLRPAMAQSLHLMNSDQLHAKLTSTDAAARVQRLATSQASAEEVVTELYLACYARRPSAEELALASGVLSADPSNRRAAIEDVMWSLINSAEFVFNH